MDVLKAIESIVGSGEIVHTHASSVLITADYVYKIKKSVYFGFLDYRTLKLRRAYVILEKELNERYSQGIYLQVLKLIKTQSGFDLVDIASSLPAVEYVLKMKRIPKDAFVDKKIAQGLINVDQMSDIGQKTAEILSVAPASAVKVEDKNPYEIICFNVRENFAQIRDIAPGLMDWRLKYVETCTESFLTDYKDLFYKRHAEGFIKDGHGDLRAEHLFFSDTGLALIDCIEFNERFRTNDVVNEAAFLSMEFDYMGAIELSDAFLKGFFKYYNEPESLFLLNFYRCYRAVVRAKVAMFTLGSMEPNSAAYSSKSAELHRLCDMALMYAYTMRSITPLVFCGIIATGKSFHAKQFVKCYPAMRYGTDEVRKQAAGMKLEDSGVVQMDQGIYTDEISMAVYTMLGKMARDCIKVGRLPLVDGTFSKPCYQKAFTDVLYAQPCYVLFTAPDEIIRKRLSIREERNSVTDGRLRHLDGFREREKDLPKPTFTVDTSEDVAGVEGIIQRLILNA